MEIRKITEDNAEDYSDILSADAVQSIEREFYRGLALHEDDETMAAAIWELRNPEEEIPTEAEMVSFYVKDGESGRKFFEAYKDEISEDDITRTFFEFEEYDDNMVKVTDAAGFEPSEKEGRDIAVTLDELASLSFMKKQVPSYITNISELMVRQYRKGITNALFHGRKGILEDLAFLPMTWFDQDVSSCVQTDGKANGFFLIHKNAKDELVVDLLFAMEPDAKINLISMIRYSINAAVEKYPGDTKVIFKRHNEMTAAFTAKLFPDKKGQKVLAGERGE